MRFPQPLWHISILPVTLILTVILTLILTFFLTLTLLLTLLPTQAWELYRDYAAESLRVERELGCKDLNVRRGWASMGGQAWEGHKKDIKGKEWREKDIEGKGGREKDIEGKGGHEKDIEGWRERQRRLSQPMSSRTAPIFLAPTLA